MKHWVAERRNASLHYDHLTNDELCKLINLDYQSDEFYEFERERHVYMHIETLRKFNIESEDYDEHGDFDSYRTTWHVEFCATNISEVEAIAEWIRIKTGIE